MPKLVNSHHPGEAFPVYQVHTSVLPAISNTGPIDYKTWGHLTRSPLIAQLFKLSVDYSIRLEGLIYWNG